MTPATVPTTRPLHVLHLASADLWAGAEVQILHLLHALSRVAQLRLTAVLMNEGELAHRLRALGLHVVVLDETRHGSVTLFFRFFKLMRDLRPDVIHAHRIKEGVFAAFAGLLNSGVASIRTVHGSAEHAAASSLRRRFALFLERFVARRLQYSSVAVSPALATELATALPGARVRCITNGLDEELVRRQADVASRVALDDAVRVCFAGRLSPVKRIDVFLQVAAELARRAPGKFRSYVIGDGPLRDELERQAHALQVAGDVRFLGFHANCLPLVASMSVLVLTSDHEGLPMIALEALSLGVPVVSHAVGGLPQLLQSPSTGRLVPSQDPKAFADAIEACAVHSNMPRRSLLPAEFTAEHCARQYVELYREAASAS